MNVNRSAAITWPTRLQQLLSVKCTSYVIGGIAIFSASVTSWTLFFYDLLDKSEDIRNSSLTKADCKAWYGDESVDASVIVIGWVQPVLPLLLVLVVGLFLGSRLIQLYIQRKTLITNQQRSRHNTSISTTNTDAQSSTNETRKRSMVKKRLADTSIPKEIRMAAAIVTMSCVYVIIEGLILSLQGVLLLKDFRSLEGIDRMDAEKEEIEDIADENVLKSVFIRIQNVSLLLRVWNCWAYFYLMPSFRKSVFAGINFLMCKKIF